VYRTVPLWTESPIANVSVLLRISVSGVREGQLITDKNNIDVLFKYPRSCDQQTTLCYPNFMRVTGVTHKYDRRIIPLPRLCPVTSRRAVLTRLLITILLVIAKPNLEVVY
jgi:hypothetical protein